MTGRETVAAALIAQMRDGACEWDKLSRPDQEFALGLADAAFAAVTLVAGERGWHMRPDEATKEMLDTISAGTEIFGPDVLKFWRDMQGKHYLAMLADPTAQFEWQDK